MSNSWLKSYLRQASLHHLHIAALEVGGMRRSTGRRRLATARSFRPVRGRRELLPQLGPRTRTSNTFRPHASSVVFLQILSSHALGERVLSVVVGARHACEKRGTGDTSFMWVVMGVETYRRRFFSSNPVQLVSRRAIETACNVFRRVCTLWCSVWHPSVFCRTIVAASMYSLIATNGLTDLHFLPSALL